MGGLCGNVQRHEVLLPLAYVSFIVVVIRLAAQDGLRIRGDRERHNVVWVFMDKEILSCRLLTPLFLRAIPECLRDGPPSTMALQV